MRLLVIDPDKHLSEIVRTVMRGEGHDVVIASTGDQALRTFRESPTELVLGLMELEGEDGVDVLRRIRSARGGEDVSLILMSGYRRRYDRQVQDAMAELGIRDFIRHPFSVLDLVDMLRRLQPQTEVVTPREPPPVEEAPVKAVTRRRFSSRNLSGLARLWCSRASGILQVDNAPGDMAGGVSGWVTLQDGGPAHANDWDLIKALLLGGEMNFERAAIDGTGDRSGLGQLLLSMAKDDSKIDFGELHRYDAVLCTEPVEVIVSLPLSEPLRKLLRAADGTAPLGEQVAQSGEVLRTLSSELYALRQLHMIAFQSPLARTSGSGASIKRARQDGLAPPRPPSWLSDPPSVSTETAPPEQPSWLSDELIDEEEQAIAPSWLDEPTFNKSPSTPGWLTNEESSSQDNTQDIGWLDDASDWSNSVWSAEPPETEWSPSAPESDLSAEAPEMPSWLESEDLEPPEPAEAPDLPDWMLDSFGPESSPPSELSSPPSDLSSSPPSFPFSTPSQPPSQPSSSQGVSFNDSRPGSRPVSERRSSRSRMTEELRERRAGHWRKQRLKRAKVQRSDPRRSTSTDDGSRSDISSQRRQDPETLRRIFSQELERLRSARPAVVLGVPADAEAMMITQSARRLRQRYKTVADDRRMPEDVRLQAEELKSMVYAAYKRLKRGDDDLLSDAPVTQQADNVEWLLSEGRRLIAEQSWAQADKVLSRAHRLKIDHAGVLSMLGWSRFHNPTREVEVREDEAVDLLILATQFDAENVDTRYYLARILAARNEIEGALRQAVQGLRIRPDHAEMGALLKTLRTAQS